MAQANRAVAERMVAADEGMPGINVKKCFFCFFLNHSELNQQRSDRDPGKQSNSSQIAGM